MDEQRWFYRVNDRQYGPVSRDDILRLLTLGELTADEHVWAEGMENWQPIGHITDFAAVLPAGQERQRPTSITVLGILNIVFGGLGLLCAPLAVFSILTPQSADPYELSEGMKAFSLVGQALGFVLSIVLVASGIGLLNLKKWARQAACIYAWISIGWMVLAIIAGVIMLTSYLNDIPPDAGPEEIGGMIGGMVGGMCGGLIYPIILLVFLRKPHVIEACTK